MKEHIHKLPDDDVQRLKGRRVILSLSGGKDSTAAGLMLQQAGIEFDCVFMDTGWEHPSTYEYIDTVLTQQFGSIKTVQAEYDDEPGDGQFMAMVKKEGVIPSRLMRICTDRLKVRPFKKFLSGLEEDPVVVIGIRRAESQKRSGYERWHFSGLYDSDVFAPLVDMTLDDVIEIHKSASIPPNPLYLSGASRVGCFPCIFARKSELAMVPRLLPTRVDDIEHLEKHVSERHGRDVTFFHGRHIGLPIREAVQWAQTAHGGKQIMLFDMTAQDGCTRWGMCDAAMSDEELVKIGNAT